MTGRLSRRRLRLRRKRKDETFGSKLSDTGQAANQGSPAPYFDSGDAVEVVARLGCCVVEAIGSAAVLLALLSVPAYLLIARVT